MPKALPAQATLGRRVRVRQAHDDRMIIAGHLQTIGYRPHGLVHVGAHMAEEMDAYCALGVQKLVWVEADPIQAARLRGFVAASARAEIQVVVEALITDTDGDTRAFHRFSNDGESSSIFRGTDVLYRHWPSIRETGDVIHLPTSRLDTALRRAAIEPVEIDVLVLDVQGAEVLALDGAGAFLEGVAFVEAEVSREGIYEGAPLVSDVIERLVRAGFEPVTEIPWHGDVVFARRES